jgi:hypothetical protein
LRLGEYVINPRVEQVSQAFPLTQFNCQEKKTFADELDRRLMMTSTYWKFPTKVKLHILLHQAAEGEPLAGIEGRLQHRGFHAKRSIRIHRCNSLLLRSTLALRSASSIEIFPIGKRS